MKKEFYKLQIEIIHLTDDIVATSGAGGFAGEEDEITFPQRPLNTFID